MFLRSQCLGAPGAPDRLVTSAEKRRYRENRVPAGIDDLSTRVLAFIDPDNRSVRPFKWTSQAMVLTA